MRRIRSIFAESVATSSVAVGIALALIGIGLFLLTRAVLRQTPATPTRT